MASGEVGPAEVQLLQSAQRSRLLLALKALRDVSPVENGEDRTAVARIHDQWEQLCRLQEMCPEAVENVLRDPAVAGTCFRLLRAAPAAGDGTASRLDRLAAVGDFLASLTAAVCVQTQESMTVEAAVVDGQLWLPSLGVAAGPWRRGRMTARVHRSQEGWCVTGPEGSVVLPREPAREGPGWFPVSRISAREEHGELRVTVDSVSPYRDFRGRRPVEPLSPESRRRWLRLLAESWRLVLECAPREAVTVAGMVRSLVPLPGPERRRTSSASHSDAFGQILLSPPLDPVELAATLVHEARHQQLNALMTLTCLYQPEEEEQEERYFAPWRADPRPFLGLLHGAHAFGGVARFWLGATKAGPAAGCEGAWFEYALAVHQLRAALPVLRTGRGLTSAGHRVVDGLAHLLRNWRAVSVPEQADSLAAWRVADRRSVWRARHMTLPRASVEALMDAWRRGGAPPSLPEAGLAPRLSDVRPDVRTALVRLRLTEPELFAEVSGVLRAGGGPADLPGATAGDAAAAGGLCCEAVSEYRRTLRADPCDVTAWTGLALSVERCPHRGDEPWTRLLLERPEAVRVLQEALGRDGTVVHAETLARWLSGPPTH
ncbi:HEXXH motif-containing putative peptide modification protein [Streptomyces sp. NPDC004542]|uniref:aKG-HExxH-type peptide beta-hydroxylase n=1 Tax=Streptomyces sp. NPDC004542 TaxID=3154281 RepID=UPI0033BAADB2